MDGLLKQIKLTFHFVAKMVKSISKVVGDVMVVHQTVLMDQMKKTVWKNVLRISSNVEMVKYVSKVVGDVTVVKTVLMDQTKKIVNIWPHFQMSFV